MGTRAVVLRAVLVLAVLVVVAVGAALMLAERPAAKGLGVDVSEALLTHAREKAQRGAISILELRLADAESLDGLPSEAFDAATGSRRPRGAGSERCRRPAGGRRPGRGRRGRR